MATTPRQRRKKKNKEAILKIARKMIANKGYESTSLRAIANAADYSPAGLYEYFDSKEALLEAISDQINTEMAAAVQQVSSELPVSERLAQMWLRYVSFCLKNKELFNLVTSIPSRRTSLEQPPAAGSVYNLLLSVTEAFIQKHKIPKKSAQTAEEMTYGLWALAHGMVTLRTSYLRDFDADFERINQKIMHDLIQSYLASAKGDIEK